MKTEREREREREREEMMIIKRNMYLAIVNSGDEWRCVSATPQSFINHSDHTRLSLRTSTTS